MWLLALAVALLSARYFLVPPPLVNQPTLHIYSHHPVWFLSHVAGGIVALIVGLFQFVGSLRDSRPALHRALGRVYLGAVFLAGSTGLPLSFLFLGPFPAFTRSDFYPAFAGFASLSLVWPFISLVALARARQRRFADHRAWMMRSYCLTFAAVTVRLVFPVFLFLTRNMLVSFNAAILSWPLNLIVAEWLIRRAAQQQKIQVDAQTRAELA